MSSIAAAAIAVFTGLVSVGPPPQLPVQGTLRSVGGEGVDGSFALRFRLYEGEATVDPFFEENFEAVVVKDGVMSVVLGAVEALDAAKVANAPEVWIGIKVEGEPELPRRRLLSTPYALAAGHALSADKALGINCSGCITADHLAPGALPPNGQLPVAPPAACAPATIGQAYYDTAASALRVCDGSSYRKITFCSEVCPVATAVACGQAISDGCGESCETTGSALNLAQCGDASAVACGVEIKDDCDNVCPATGTAPNAAQCDETAVACGVPVFDGCQNSCGTTGTLCGGLAACVAGECTLPKSCKDVLAATPGAANGSYQIDPDGPGGKPAFQVTCDMETAPGGWTLINMDYLRLHATLTTQTNANGESHAYVDGNTKYYGFSNQHDYEVWNDFDIGFNYTAIRGAMTWYPSAGGLTGWTQSGAHPDNQNYGIQSDSDYNQLGVTGEGGGNKSWHRWGKPGQVFHAYTELGFSGEWSSPKTTTFGSIITVSGSVIRVSTFSESGDPGKERWAFTPALYVR